MENDGASGLVAEWLENCEEVEVSRKDSASLLEQDAIKQIMNTMRKQMEEDGIIDKFKLAFEATVRDDEEYIKIKDKINQILSPSQVMSYEDVFRKVGGPEFEKTTLNDDLDKILEKLVEKEVNVNDKTRDKFFKECDRIYKSK